MELFRLFRIMARHWAITGLVLVLTGVSAVALGLLIKPVYQTDSSLLLLSPDKTYNNTGQQVRVNPYSRFGQSGESLLSTSIVNLLNSDSKHRDLEASGFKGDYSVDINPTGGGAILDISVLAPSAQLALSENTQLQSLISQILADRQAQAGAPSDSIINAQVLTAADQTSAVLTTRYKAMAVIGVVGLLVAAGCAVLAERAALAPARHGRFGETTPAEPLKGSGLVPVLAGTAAGENAPVVEARVGALPRQSGEAQPVAVPAGEERTESASASGAPRQKKLGRRGRKDEPRAPRWFDTGALRLSDLQGGAASPATDAPAPEPAQPAASEPARPQSFEPSVPPAGAVGPNGSTAGANGAGFGFGGVQVPPGWTSTAFDAPGAAAGSGPAPSHFAQMRMPNSARTVGAAPPAAGAPGNGSVNRPAGAAGAGVGSVPVAAGSGTVAGANGSAGRFGLNGSAANGSAANGSAANGSAANGVGESAAESSRNGADVASTLRAFPGSLPVRGGWGNGTSTATGAKAPEESIDGPSSDQA